MGKKKWVVFRMQHRTSIRRKRKNKGDAQNAKETSMMKEKWVVFRMGGLWNAKQTSMEKEKWVIFGMQNKLSWKEKG
jgi:hypothetical protein